MKTLHIVLLAMVAVPLLTSCEHNVTSETTVHTDGSLDKKFVFDKDDSVLNILGLRREGGWRKTVQAGDSSSAPVKSYEYSTTYEKTYVSAEDANRELAAPNDSLLRITSSFEKRFRWFYTYIRYTETIHALNWLRLKPDDYLVQEDYAFIERLPAEGKPISKADEFYLSELNNRMYDVYGMRALFEEYLNVGTNLLKEQQLDQRWLDTIRVHQNDLFAIMKSKEGDMKDMPHAIHSIGIPLDTASFGSIYRSRCRPLNGKTSFISIASEGKYKYIVHLPWPLTSTNADSVSGTTVAWAPPPIKFLLKDYTMYSECRTPNYLLWLLSGSVVIFTGYLFVRPRKR